MRVLLLSMVLLFVMSRDIIDSRVLVKRAAVGPKWPSRRIPYDFSKLMPFDSLSKDKIRTALKDLERDLTVGTSTCLEFVLRKPDDNQTYILFENNKDCSSNVGFHVDVSNNSISLNSINCLGRGTIMHEVMHMIGFDHEQARFDRDDNVHVLVNHTLSEAYKTSNFLRNNMSSVNNSFGTPYDFYSILHYNSDAFQELQTSGRTIMSKFPKMSRRDKYHIDRPRTYLSNIDIIEVQRLYACRELEPAKITHIESPNDKLRFLRVKKRFELETSYDGIAPDIVNEYINRTFRTCGMNHYWPLDYPLVKDTNELYAHVCELKKGRLKPCRYSYECKGEHAICMRSLISLVKKGRCFHTTMKQVDAFSEILSEKLFKGGRKLKELVKSAYLSIKEKFKD